VCSLRIVDADETQQQGHGDTGAVLAGEAVDQDATRRGVRDRARHRRDLKRLPVEHERITFGPRPRDRVELSPQLLALLWDEHVVDWLAVPERIGILRRFGWRA
jgi:hypothetical protein